jgi:hypothetical protein
VARPNGTRGLDPYPVDPDVPGPAGTGRGQAGLGQPHRPDPAVHPPAPLTFNGMSATDVTGGLEPPEEGHHIPRDDADGTVVFDGYIFDASIFGCRER